MSIIDRRLMRIACRVHSAYAAIPTDRRDTDLPQQAWNDVQAAHSGWAAARNRGWNRAAAQQRQTLVRELEDLNRDIRNRLSAIASEQPQVTPSLRLLFEELVAADGEFEGVLLSEKELSVTTEPIVLDDVELGRFKIRLHLDRLGVETPYRVRALEPHPAASCAETTHPHVSGEQLCAGEGRRALAAALAEGRLFDFFTIVDRILHTYAEGSAYVELAQWYGIRCHDCDATVHEEDVCTCARCEDRVCDDCLVHCGGCSDGYCSTCIDRCARCEEYACSNCLTTCAHCRRSVCGACLEEELCETCREELEEEPDEEESVAAPIETIDAAPEPTI